MLLLAAAPAPPDPHQQLDQIEHSRAAGEAARRAAAARLAAAQFEQLRLADARVQAAARQQDADQAVDEAATKLADLAARRRQAERRLASRAADMAPLLPLLERLSLFPAETMLAVPAPPEDALRGVLVLKGLAHLLEDEAAALRDEQAEVAALERATAAALPALQAAQAAQKAAAEALDQQLAEARENQRAAVDAAEQAARQAAADAARADSLRAAIAQMDSDQRDAIARARDDADRAERQRREADAEAARTRELALARPAGPGLSIPEAGPPGELGQPVAGRIVREFGEPGDAGPALGISYAAAPAARVVAPCAGRAVFAGPFRSFGLLLILNCGGGYHFVLAGLDRLDVTVGRPVAAGEPVGVMPDWDPQSSGPRPVLYVELRHDGQPVNPAPWLKANG